MRFSFGGDLTGWHFGYGDLATTVDTALSGRTVIALGGVDVTFWDARTGGAQYTDLQDASGAAITAVQTSQGSANYPLGVMPQFLGPDAVPVMWAQAGAAPRLRVTAVDAYNFYQSQLSAVSTMQSTLSTLGDRVSAVETSDTAQNTAITDVTNRASSLETAAKRPIAELRTTALNSLNDSTWTTILFGGEAVDTDPDSVGGHSTTTNTGRYTARYAGLYLVAGHISYAANAAGSRYARWTVNGTTRPGSSGVVGYNPTGGAIAAHAPTMVLVLAVGDYVELQGFQNSATTLTTWTQGDYQPHFTVVYLRANP
jgi:hypothetical protein